MSIQIQVQPLLASDYDHVKALSKLHMAGRHGAFSLAEQLDSKKMIARYVLRDCSSGALLGYALLAEQIAPMVKLRVEVVAHEGETREIYYPVLYEAVEFDIIAAAPYSVEARVFGTSADERRFYESAGYREDHRMVHYGLDVAALDLESESTKQPANVSGSSIIIRSMADECRERPDCMEALTELVLDTNTDFPTELPVHLRQPNTDTGWLHKPDLVPDAFFIAIDRGNYAGYTVLYPSAEEAYAFQGNTAVRRDYRNKGIATALKKSVIAFAKRHSIRSIYTSTRSTNPAMASVNEKLGWKVSYSELRMVNWFHSPGHGHIHNR
ncbi:GNAT family N-acetyltransferase [Paenibacillus sp. NPDC056579]|uniref:GNAT family N-acetyltransferase n=1 Tax=Paenibacillus sp. NPDC056579 TaxID=3345871 RepID=UPI003687EFC8